MTDKAKNKPKNSQSPLLREAKPKNRLGLKVPQLRLPHDELISPPREAEKETSGSLPSLSRQTTLTEASTNRQGSQQYLKNSDTPDREEKTGNLTLAPTRNYQKVPNSLTKQAIPGGLFKGKSKQLYDVLYSLTRGAINATRAVRISKTKLMKLAGIGSRITFDSNVKHLKFVGLIEETVFIGEHEGNEFEVFLPEEVLKSESSLTRQSSQTSSPQKQDRLVTLETSHTRHSLNYENTNSYSDAKTSLKTFKTDDDEKNEVLGEFFEEIERVSKKLTGKGLQKTEAKKWGDVAKLLVMELELAAARTESVSSVPAFLREVLRRKLEGKSISNQNSPRKSRAKETTVTSLEVGKPRTDAGSIQAKSGTWEKERMTTEEKQKTLQIMKERIEEGHKSLVMSMKPVFAEEDWMWLMENLPKK